MAKAGLDIGGILSLFIGIFVLFTLVDALYSTVNTAVSNLNITMTTGGYGTSGNMVIYGWKILQYVVGLGALIVGAKVLVDKAKEL
jgi:hypothetical protein